MKIKFYTAHLTSEQKLQFNKVSSEEGIKAAETLDNVETASRDDILDKLCNFDVYNYIDFESFLFDLKKAGNAIVYSSHYLEEGKLALVFQIVIL